MVRTTSPYLSGPDILEHPTRTVKEVHLDYSSAPDGCIKAGSPISAAGKVANDATAIGILLHDSYSDCGCGHGLVVVAGRIDAAVAEQNSGIIISAEAKGGMPAVAFVDAAGVVTGGGSIPKPIPYDYMPEGYPKIDQNAVTIFDQTVEGFVDRGAVYDAEISDSTFEPVVGEKYTVVWDGVEYTDLVAIEDQGAVLIGVDPMEELTEESPFLVVFIGEIGVCAVSTISTEPSHAISIAHISEVVTPMDDRFMGNSTFVVNGTMSGSDWVKSYDKTYEEVTAAFDAGKTVICNLFDSDGTVLYRNFIAYMHNEKGVWFTGFDSYNNRKITLSIPAPNKDEYFWNSELVSVYPEFGHKYFILNDNEYFEKNTLILESSTSGSTKRFRINVDDSGTLTATEVT